MRSPKHRKVGAHVSISIGAKYGSSCMGALGSARRSPNRKSVLVCSSAQRVIEARATKQCVAKLPSLAWMAKLLEPFKVAGFPHLATERQPKDPRRPSPSRNSPKVFVRNPELAHPLYPNEGAPGSTTSPCWTRPWTGPAGVSCWDPVELLLGSGSRAASVPVTNEGVL